MPIDHSKRFFTYVHREKIMIFWVALNFSDMNSTSQAGSHGPFL